MDWAKEGVNYWENPKCPKPYLEGALVRLINDIEGVDLSIDFFKNIDRDLLVKEIAFYESVSDK